MKFEPCTLTGRAPSSRRAILQLTKLASPIAGNRRTLFLEGGTQDSFYECEFDETQAASNVGENTLDLMQARYSMQ
jgi:hypothetical protein